MLEQIRDALLAFFDRYELLELFVLVAVHEAGVPSPVGSDLLVAYAGIRHGQDTRFALPVIGIAAGATTIGASALFWVVRSGGTAVVGRLTRFLHVKPAQMQRVHRLLARQGALTIFVARLVPGLAIPTIVTAGLGPVRFSVFAASVFAAAAVWNALLYFTGGVLTRASEYVSVQTGISQGWLVAGSVAAGAAGVMLWFVVSRLRRRRSPVPRPDEATAEHASSDVIERCASRNDQ